MTKTLEEQAIDNESRIALMAAIIASGILANPNRDLAAWKQDDYTGCASATVRLALAIQKEAGK